MTQSIEPNEQSTEVNLTQLLKEMLEYILIHLDFDDLLTASHVCIFFASIAETAFARKRSNEYYNINRSRRPQRNKDKVMVDKFGGQMQKISIENFDGKLLESVEQKCCNLKGVEIIFDRELIVLKNLKEVCLGGITFLRRLTNLELQDTIVVLLDILDGRLKMLKKIALSDVEEMRSLEDLPKIKLNSLETLNFTCIYDGVDIFYSRLLRALSSNKVKHLNFYGDVNKNEDIIDEVCKFKALVSLQMRPYYITSDQVRKLAVHLPDLIYLSMAIAESEPNSDRLILSMLSMFPKLAQLSIRFHADHSDRLSKTLKSKSSVKDLHDRFAKDNFETELECFGLTVLITKKIVC